MGNVNPAWLESRAGETSKEHRETHTHTHPLGSAAHPATLPPFIPAQARPSPVTWSPGFQMPVPSVLRHRDPTAWWLRWPPSDKRSLAQRISPGQPGAGPLQMGKLRPESRLQHQQGAPHPHQARPVQACGHDSHPPCQLSAGSSSFLAGFSQHVSEAQTRPPLPRRPVQNGL